MTHKYTIEGMTCSGCEAKVKNDLSKVENDIILAQEKEIKQMKEMTNRLDK
jgi:Cu2+-exporting ATPase